MLCAFSMSNYIPAVPKTTVWIACIWRCWYCIFLCEWGVEMRCPGSYAILPKLLLEMYDIVFNKQVFEFPLWFVFTIPSICFTITYLMYIIKSVFHFTDICSFFVQAFVFYSNINHFFIESFYFIKPSTIKQDYITNELWKFSSFCWCWFHHFKVGGVIYIKRKLLYFYNWHGYCFGVRCFKSS